MKFIDFPKRRIHAEIAKEFNIKPNACQHKVNVNLKLEKDGVLPVAASIKPVGESEAFNKDR